MFTAFKSLHEWREVHFVIVQAIFINIAIAIPASFEVDSGTVVVTQTNGNAHSGTQMN